MNSINVKCPKKPPMGPIPREFWEENRMQELVRAIHLRIEHQGGVDKKSWEWVRELADLDWHRRDRLEAEKDPDPV